MSGMDGAPNDFIADDTGSRYTTAILLSELSAFARNNPRFASGDIDQIKFELQETEFLRGPLSPETLDIVAEMDEAERIDFVEQDLGRVGLKYTFFVERLAVPGGRKPLGFTFSVAAVSTKIQMPAQIAAVVLPDHEPEIAVQLMGPSTAERELKFGISTIDRMLQFCQEDTYYDQDNTPINVICTCSLPDHEHQILENIVDLDELGISYEEALEGEQDAFGSLLEAAGVEEDEDEVAEYNPAGLTLDRMENEKIVVETPEEALALWASFADIDTFSLEQSLDNDREDQYIKLALGVLGNIKRILREQAGVK